MNKSKNLIAGIGISALLIFFIYTAFILSKPEPIEVQGEVEATHVKVASKLIGRIDSLVVKKGQYVNKGDLLFLISSPEVAAKMEQAQAARSAAEAQRNKAYNGAQIEDIQAAYNTYLKAQAAADLADKTFKRVDNLNKEGVVPDQKRDEAETQLKAARQTAYAAKAVWIKARKGARIEDKAAAVAMVNNTKGIISEVQSYLNETKIFAPISGEIANIISERGELVPSGYPVISIVDLSDVWITFNLREDLLAKIRMGSIFSARFPALGNKEVRLKVSYINALGEFATWNSTKTSGDFDMKTFEVHAVPVNKVDGLRPGMSAIVNWSKVGEK
ncbi:MAG: efflux RND transporter periplasmic adaptor subunit [Bacteroidota bacterium]|nr:efflux RND transporter periplasmic adaptor subunit [Bacteroidota bacterium]MDP4204799.1 efflux RND transporter periplasmic adaptor subunit [Bacteroidota bacterium]